MRAFVDLYLALDATNSTSEKASLLVDFLSSATDADAAWCVGLIGGHRPKGTASTTTLESLVLKRTGLPEWLVGECRAAVGELSETLALLTQGAAIEHAPLSLAETIDRFVLPLAGLDEQGKAKLISEAWDRFDADERFVYHKIVRGGLRVGVAAGLLSRAIAEAADLPRELVQHRLAASFVPTAQGWKDLTAPFDGTRVGPYPFFLASQLETSPAELGDRDQWTAEWKWDGIRAQLVRRKGHTSLWSRTGESIDAQFPEIVAAGRSLPDGTVLDGEVLLLDLEGRPKPFAALQKRLNRKVAPTVQLGLFPSERAVFRAFDLLEHEGNDLRQQPLGERRPLLDAVLPIEQTIDASSIVEAASWEALADLRSQSRSRGVEGLMLKHRSSTYGVGRTKDTSSNAGWWKWKVDPYTADLVLTTAYPGSGRRASLYTDYGFSTPGPDGELVQVTRAYSGLSNDEIEKLDSWIRRHTTQRHGPVRSVEPTRLFEIGFEGIAESDRHKAGLAMRFPRILRERTDKPVAEATSLIDLQQLASMG